MLREFGKRLKEERERLGLAPGALAKALGIDKSSLYGYERGDRSPPSIHLLALVSLGADPKFLLTGDRDRAKTSQESAEEIIDVILELAGSSFWSKLTDEEKKEAAMRFIVQGGQVDSSDVA